MPAVNPTTMPLSEPHLTKGLRHARALRRATLAFWYATIEDAEAAAIEAGNATFQVNILDETVFAEAHGAAYQSFRANDRLGHVVMGLELIRNCETHSPEVFGDLLAGDRYVSVPTDAQTGALMRAIYSWPALDELPGDYIERSDLTANQKRARAQSIDSYQREVENRPVIETLLDAVEFMETLDSRLRGEDPISIRWAFSLLPDDLSDEGEPTRLFIARPMGLDLHELILPDLSCHSDERRSTRQNASDRTFEGRAKLGNKLARKQPPAASSREITHRLVDHGTTVGYAGSGGSAVSAHRPFWAETCGAVWRDVQSGYRYWVGSEGGDIDVTHDNRTQIHAIDGSGDDLIDALAASDDSSEDSFAELHAMWQQYPDLYMQMRCALDVPVDQGKVSDEGGHEQRGGLPAS